jgi:iron(III) transport system substrate-binding protein
MLIQRLLSAIFIAGVVAAASAPAAGQPKLIVYSANEANLNRFTFEAFTRETGIVVEQVEAGSGVIMRRIQSERQRPLGDVVWGVNRTLLQVNKALLAPYVSKHRDAVPAQFRSPEDLWLGTNVHILVILQNTRLVPSDTGPKGWADLLDPAWKGKIAFADPANSGAAYATVTMLAQLWGPGETGWDKVSRLMGNIRILNRQSLVFQGVGNGEFPLAMSLEYAGAQWAANGAPVKVIYPQDGTLAQMEGVGLIRGGPNPDAAKQFVDYVSRKDVREQILRFAFRRPARTDLELASLPGQMPALSQLQIADYDEDAWTVNRSETLQKIQDIIRRTR